MTSNIENNYPNTCFICKKKCKTLKIDREVEKEIEKIRQQNLENPPDIIYYKKNGEFRWGEIENSDNEMEPEKPVIIPQVAINFDS